ncbi:hypothetical protein Tco_0544951 [Tanacetum coccineum]
MERRLRDGGGGDGGGGGSGGGEVFGGSVVFSGDGAGNGVTGVVCGVALWGCLWCGLWWCLLRRSRCAEGKDSFVKCDMTRNNDFVGVQVKAPISTMIVMVLEKDRWCGTRGKFVRWKGVRVTKASKRAKVGVKDKFLDLLSFASVTNGIAKPTVDTSSTNVNIRALVLDDQDLINVEDPPMVLLVKIKDVVCRNEGFT